MVGASPPPYNDKSQRQGRSKAHSLRQWLGAGFDLLFPIQCAGCRTAGSVWCEDCDGQLIRVREPICQTCGLDLRGRRSCPSCREREPSVLVRSYARYTGRLVQALLHLKYRPDQALARVMGGWMAELLDREDWEPAVVVPVPLGRRRRQQRGFNQAELLAEALARHISLPVRGKALWRVKETRSQVGLDQWERWQNVGTAFEARSGQLPDRGVLLVDDLMTTGATLSACAQALQAAGVRQIWGVTVGRA